MTTRRRATINSPTKRYIVSRPEHLPEGCVILCRKDGTEYYEGDDWYPQDTTPDYIIEKFLTRGYIVDPDSAAATTGEEIDDGEE